MVSHLRKIEHKGNISVPVRMYKNDGRFVGQILKWEFEIDVCWQVTILASLMLLNKCELRHPSRNVPLDDSVYAFSYYR
jgi:hypothetical protein